MSTRCMKCGSDRVIPKVQIVDQGQHSDGSLKAHLGYTNPENWIFKGPIFAGLLATICGQCGHVELTAAGDPGALYESYLKVKDQSS